MFDHLANLMEDALDFSCNSAKAFDAILQTNIEADRLSWTETEKIDSFRRAHAQRHITGKLTSASHSVAKKPKISKCKRNIFCKNFLEGICKYLTHHRTAGYFYRHFCLN